MTICMVLAIQGLNVFLYNYTYGPSKRRVKHGNANEENLIFTGKTVTISTGEVRLIFSVLSKAYELCSTIKNVFLIHKCVLTNGRYSFKYNKSIKCWVNVSSPSAKLVQH